MAVADNEPRIGRETRLLLLVVGVAIVVLLLLARWRFPESDLSVMTPAAAPLAGLAARATFDEMANTMTDVIGRVSPLTFAVALMPVPPPEPPPGRGRGRGAAAPAEPPSPPQIVWTLAVRVRNDLSLVHVPADWMLQGSAQAPMEVVAQDPSREVALLRSASGATAPDTLSAAVRTFPTFAFVAAVSATAVGPTVQPVFIGRADTSIDPRWSHPLVPAAVAPDLRPGTLLFSLNSRFIGMVMGGSTGEAIVPAPALETLVQALEATAGSSPQ
jgi:hypothetical protein